MVPMRAAITGLVALALAGCAARTDEIRIGFIGPLTGDAVSYGTDTLHAAELAIADVNAAGGVRGRRVMLVAEDGRCDASEAASAAQKLVNVDRVAAIIGGNCSTETLAIAPIVERAGVVALAPLSSSPLVTNAGDFVFRMYPSGALVGRIFGDFFRRRGVRRVAILSEETDFCQGLRKAVKEALPAGMELRFDASVPPGTKDMRSLLGRLSADGVDAVVLLFQSDAGIAASYRQLRELGIEAFVVGNDIAESNTLAATAGSELDGMHIIAVASPDNGRPSARAFQEAFVRAYGTPRQNFSNPALAYDAAFILSSALESSGPDGRNVRGALNRMMTFPGVMGDISFDRNGDVRGVAYAVKRWKGGVVEQIELVPLE